MIREDINEVIDNSDLLIVGLSGGAVSDAVQARATAEHTIVDLAHMTDVKGVVPNYIGLCW